MTADRLCYTVKGFNGERVLIPGCMGAAAMNHQTVAECFCRASNNEERAYRDANLRSVIAVAVDQLGKHRVTKIIQEALEDHTS